MLQNVGIADQQKQGSKVEKIAYNSLIYSLTLHIFSCIKRYVGWRLYSELFYAIIPNLLCFFVDLLSPHLVTFSMFLILYKNLRH